MDGPAADYDELDDEEKTTTKAVSSLIPTIAQSKSNNYTTSQNSANEYDLPIVCYLLHVYISISNLQETIVAINNQEFH